MPCYLPPKHAWAGLPFCPGTHLQWEPCSEVGGFSGEYRASLTVSGGNIRIEKKLYVCMCAFGLGLYICKCMWRSESDVSVFLS